MAVYKRTYRGYSGSITDTWSRFLDLLFELREVCGKYFAVNQLDTL